VTNETNVTYRPQNVRSLICYALGEIDVALVDPAVTGSPARRQRFALPLGAESR